jgi:hypothetical protein
VDFDTENSGLSRSVRYRNELLGENRGVVLVSPPWGAAFSFVEGLDLQRTHPPVNEILSFVRERLPRHELIFVIQTHERMVAESVAAITAGRNVYAQGVINASARPERNQGYLVCSA